MRRPRVSARTAVFAGVGVAVVAVAVGLVVAPDRLLALPVLSAVVEALADVDPGQALLVVAAVVALFVLWLVRSRGSAPDDAFDRLVATPPESVSTGAVVAGRQFDDQFAAAGASRDRWAESGARTHLRHTAVDVVALTEGTEDATRAVDRGTWTDDRLAAATLAGVDGPRPPLWARLRHWLDPESERERRLRRTVAALEARLEADR
ncbi:hypothetical protein SAMN04487949_3012 [Halogranum gelatinilyticum]|uniref:Uncharacterized protein n=1 Tax=Halogranum gelatinilyticum TaxID=660521 RepID=A0A1G9XIU3_9EURY|nr:hypothetical protein [Halogranum gelatinilyticum]SDM96729.1 hypothetical protein SAMN04487949_3012 [Halogranum gelatinilyticum]